MSWSAEDIPDLTGKTAVVTGGNGGLGLETVRQLAAHGAQVVIGARNLEKAGRALEDVSSTVEGASLEVVHLDLGSLASVAAFADQVQRSHPRIHLLFNNAGVMAVPEGTTEDGFETQFGTNHLGHFALTLRLMPSLLAGAPARVVSTTSTARFSAGAYDLTNPHLRGRYRPWEAYGISKRANLQFALELDHLLATKGVAGYVADPGFSRTDLQPNSVRANPGRSQRFWQWIVGRAGQSPAAGALPQLRAGTDPDAPNGSLYAPRWITAGTPVLRRPGRLDDPEQRRVLWRLSEEAVGLSLDSVIG